MDKMDILSMSAGPLRWPDRPGTVRDGQKGNKWKDMDAQSEAAGGIFVNGLLFRA